MNARNRLARRSVAFGVRAGGLPVQRANHRIVRDASILWSPKRVVALGLAIGALAGVVTALIGFWPAVR